MPAAAPPLSAPKAPAPASSTPVHTVSSRGRERTQPRLRVTHPGDPAEREADRIARAIARDAAAPAPLLRTAPALNRKAAAGAAAPPPATTARLRAAARGGTALTPAQRAFFQPRLRADLSAVRLHTGPEAGRLATSLGARALAHGRHIFFAPGEYRPETPEGVELLAHELVHTVQQGASPEARVQRKAADPVRERLPADTIAGWGLSDLLSGLSDLAHAVPGYRMLTIVLGADPITGRRVSRDAANILRALVEFLPGGAVITRVLDAYGVFERIAAIASAALDAVGLSAAGLRALLDQFLDTVSWRDVFDPAGIWRRASTIFSAPVNRLIAAGRALAGQILAIVREAVLKPLAELAEGTDGYALLKAVLGFDPVTGAAVPRTAETLIAPFLRMIGQEELWQNLQRANAIPRAFAWFQGAMAGVVALVRSIPSRFMAALSELQVTDFLVLPRAFLRLAGAFGGFMGEFARFAGSTILDLLKIIVEVVAPGVMPYIQRAGAAFQTILRNPIGFVGNLVRAGRMGFEQFAARFLTHLRAALVGWLTGTLGGTGIHIPQAFSLQEILRFVLSVLGLTWAQVRTRLVRILGEAPVRALEAGFALVRTLVTQGPAAAWQEIVAAAGNLRDMVIEQVIAFVKSRVVEAAVTRLVSMLSPAGALIQAIIAIYNTVMFFVERLRQIAQVAAAFIDSIAAIAAGSLGAAANRVEQTMAGLLTLVISFLARIAGLGRVADAVTTLIARVRAPIERGIDRVVQWIVAQARRAGRFIAQAGVPQDPATRLRLASRDSIALARALRGRSQISAAVLRVALQGLAVRYALTSIEPYQQRNEWWVRLRINPEIVTPSGLVVVQSGGGGAREQEGPNMAPLLEKLRQVFTMFERWARLGTAPVAQQMLRLVRITLDRAQALSEDQRRGVVGLGPRFQEVSDNLRAIQMLDPQYQLISIGQMTITLNQARRQMPQRTLNYSLPSNVQTSHPLYATWLQDARRQLREQEAGVNSMVASEWLARRPAPGTPFVRPAGEAAMRREYGRRSALAGTGMAAPHNPDQILAGYIDPTGEPAISYVNSFIGTQNRANAAMAQTMIEDPAVIDPIARPVTQLNFRLQI